MFHTETITETEVYMFIGGKLVTIYDLSESFSYYYANCPLVVEPGESIEFRVAKGCSDCQITLFGITDYDSPYDPAEVFKDFENNLDELSSSVGSKENLQTNDKSSTVAAINEIYNFGGTGNFRLPVGSVMPYTGATAPSQWLLCDGSEISRETYANLFNVIGTTYGAGDGSTTFMLPDMRTRVPIGSSDNYALGGVGGSATHTLTVNEMPSHSHTMVFYTETSGSSYQSFSQQGRDNATQSKTTNTTGGSQPHNNMQPYVVLNYIIKA